MDYYLLIIVLCVITILLLLLKLYVKCSTGYCQSYVCLSGKTAIVTGANSGLGFEIASELAKRGAKVILACRDSTRGKEAEKKIIAESDNPNIFFKQVDMCSFTSVRQFAKDIEHSEERLDILVNNAGVCITGDKKTEDGLLVLMQTNYFSHFLLTNLLLDLMKRSPSARIVNVSSFLASCPYSFNLENLNSVPNTYVFRHLLLQNRSKRCQVLFTMELSERLQGTNVTVYSVDPGIIPTPIFNRFYPVIRDIWRGMLLTFSKSIFEGNQTTIYCCVAHGIEHLSGQHFKECRMKPQYRSVKDPNLRKRLWEISEKLVSSSSKEKDTKFEKQIPLSL